VNPYIVSYFESFVEDDHLHIILEYVSGGDLQDYLNERKKIKQSCDEDFILKVFTQLTSALKYCSERNIIHRDIKPNNILLTKDGDIKITDFGVSKIFNTNTTNKQATSIAGTIGYQSPEMLDDQPYTFKTDLWSVGRVLYEMMTLQHPFDAKTPAGIFKNILFKQITQINSNHSDKLKKAVMMLLEKDPDFRLTFDAIEQLSF
jgi:NIMA (never in mitosis gene a)-related kinase